MCNFKLFRGLKVALDVGTCDSLTHNTILNEPHQFSKYLNSLIPIY
jgi:hypothetical protein